VNFSAQTFSRGSSKKPLLAFVFLVVGAFAAYTVAQYVIEGDLTSLAFVVAMLNNWRNGLYFFLAWLLFEDLARKFLGNNMAIYFAKDFLLFIVYLSFFLALRRKEVKTVRIPFLVPLLLLVWFGIIQIFNPASPTIFYGLLGVKLYFAYIPLLFVGYALLNSEVDLRRFFFFNFIVALIIISLGIAQSILGHTFLNPTVASDDLRELSTNYRVAPISGVVVYRPTSIFVSAGRFSDFIMVIWLMVLGFSGYLLLRHKRGRSLAFITLAVTAGGAVLTASRGTFMWSIINAAASVAAFVWGAPWKQREVTRVFRGIQRAALGVGLATVLLFFVFPDALLSRLAVYQETLSPSSTASELTKRTWDYPIDNFVGAFYYERWPYGYGIGTASLGVQYVTRFFHVKPPTAGTESGFGTLIVEMGVVGLLLWLILAASICGAAWKVVRKLKGTPWFPLGFVIAWYAFILLLPATFAGIQAYQDFVLNAYMWLLLGMLFRLPSLALSTQYAIGATPLQPPRPGIR
jgi:hypothetical protein